MSAVIQALRDLGWYASMAIGGCVFFAAFAYIRFGVIRSPHNDTDSLIFTFEGTAFLLSGILAAGFLYCRWMGDATEAGSMKKVMSWRIHLLHLCALVAVAVDWFLHRSG